MCEPAVAVAVAVVAAAAAVAMVTFGVLFVVVLPLSVSTVPSSLDWPT